jgi:hypothetical protein
MIGQSIEEKRHFIEYEGEAFKYRLSERAFQRFVRFYIKKGTNFVEQTLGNKIQKQMKKTIDTLVDGKKWEVDFQKILGSLMDDIRERKNEVEKEQDIA